MTGRLLDAIQSPLNLKKMSLAGLTKLAEEIRAELLNTVSKTGGHLAPNLGVVELTLALHQVFSCPKDKIVWDVGHQSYVHKLITGRRDRFSTLRQQGGIAGFPKREESEYDFFNTGHSSTSVSAALGLALARDLSQEDYQVVAVIGDGALTGGMAFEAMNMVGHRKTNMIVVLNDNEMSIAENVGAMSEYLARMRTDPKYSKGKDDLEQIMKKVPGGASVLKALERVKDSFKYLVVPGMLFEELGFTYLGPIDGHNLQALKKVLLDARKLQEPVLVHVITKKGRGYTPAEQNPDKFHGTGPFDLATGAAVKSPGPPSYTSVFGKLLVKLAAKDQRILGITAAMPEGTGLNYFAQKYPERYFDVGIAEQHGVTMAGALAVQGYKPVVAVYSTFMQRAYDQILHDICLQKLPVVLALDRAGLVGEDGPTHHGLFDFAFLRHIPNMVVMAPKDENELQQMLVTALDFNGPCTVRYPRGSGEGAALDTNPLALPLGKGELLREGEDCVILAIGSMVYPSLEAANMLAAKGIDAAVVNSRFVKPLDEQLILSLLQPGKLVVTVEEHSLQGGFGSAVLELLEARGITGVKVRRMGIPDEFVEHGHREALLARYCL
ncbi:MAG TPA: 1-deoxy-D-xylulose-5-phosphate synthase, partial [Bacillota bacterium]|nr:1-deoxy-D-xylulose-5-phosphate synthase [Bacillota bacterium]